MRPKDLGMRTGKYGKGESKRMLKNFAWSRDVWFVLLAKYYYGDEMKEYEMGGDVERMGKERNT
jgi:hypothetical protein